MLRLLRFWISRLKKNVVLLYLVFRDRRTPWLARIIALLAVAYAVSPVDLIPEVIPVIGLLDDIFVLAAGLYLVLWLTPPEILAACRQRAEDISSLRPWGRLVSILVLLVWGVAFYFFYLWTKDAWPF